MTCDFTVQTYKNIHELKVKFIEVWTYKLTLMIVAKINKGCKQNIIYIFVTLFSTWKQ
jgi:hypothetical protein